MNLALVKSEMFGNVQCDFWKDERNEVWMTRDQIGMALEYSDSLTAITKIHTRHKGRLDKFSVTTKLVGADGKMYETYVYSAKGVYEICRWSKQPKADEFYDMVYDLLESLRKGNTILVGNSNNSNQELEVKRMNAEARLLNARTRHIMMRYKMISGSNGVKPGMALAAATEITDKELGVQSNSVALPPANYETGKYVPSQLSEKVGLKSGVAVNKRLEELGLQFLETYTRKSRKTGEDKVEKAWRLTEEGKKYGEEFPFVRNGHSGYQIRWNDKVIDVLNMKQTG